MPTAKKSTLSFVGIILLANSYLALGETDSRNFSASGNMFVEITKFNKAKNGSGQSGPQPKEKNALFINSKKNKCNISGCESIVKT